jgi:hypothetical protein
MKNWKDRDIEEKCELLVEIAIWTAIVSFVALTFTKVWK